MHMAEGLSSAKLEGASEHSGPLRPSWVSNLRMVSWAEELTGRACAVLTATLAKQLPVFICHVHRQAHGRADIIITVRHSSVNLGLLATVSDG